jgi:predicted DNA-binding protein (MmcQ/YjbR family)
MIDYETLRAYLLDKPGATEDFPFGPEDMVAKVGGKMFALMGVLDPPKSIVLKCDPDYAEELRTEYRAITTAPYMSKQHWNAVALDGSVPDDILLSLINDSYHLVVKGLTRKAREQLEASTNDEPRTTNDGE